MSLPNSHGSDRSNAHENQSNELNRQNNEETSKDRSLSGNIGQFAMNQLLKGGKKPNENNGLGGLGVLAGQLLGGGGSSGHGSSNHGSAGIASSLVTGFLGGGGNSSHGSGNNAPAGIAGSLVTGLLGGGKKPEKQGHSNSNSQPQSGHSGLMSTVGSLLGGKTSNSQGNNFGYSQNNNPSGSYHGSAPPTSYQPSVTGHTDINHYPKPPSESHYYSANSNSSRQNQYQGQPSHYTQPPNSQPYSGPSNPSIDYQPNSHQSYYGQPQVSHNQGQPPKYDSPSSSYQSRPGYGGAPQYSANPPHGNNYNHHSSYDGNYQGEEMGNNYNPNCPVPPHGQNSNSQQQGYSGHQRW